MLAGWQLLITPPLLYILSFVFGTIFGSFFNVIVYRAGQAGPTWVKGRSQCEFCQHPLAWYDNIPLLSFIFLKGQCRYCQHPISWQHPLVELATGLVFVFSAYLALSSSLFLVLSLPLILLINSVLWLILLFDLQYMAIPNFLLIASAVLALINYLLNPGLINLIPSLAASFISLIFFIFLRFITRLITGKKGMGLGDIYLVVPLTFLLGYPRAVVGVFFAFIIGGVWGIILLLLKKKKMGQRVPFGPFLVIGTWIAMAWGNQIWQAYWQLLH
jgi:prepilin signal peptidase PulO-like enzyme (type II secretory pathway)